MSGTITTRCARCPASHLGTVPRGHAWFVSHLVDAHDIRPLAAHLAARLLFARHVERLETDLRERRAA